MAQQSESQGTPSQDAIASLITQVSPTGQPARAPTRPNRPRQQQQQGSKRAVPTAAAASTSTSTSAKREPAITSAADAVSDAAAAPSQQQQQQQQTESGTTDQQTTTTPTFTHPDIHSSAHVEGPQSQSTGSGRGLADADSRSSPEPVVASDTQAQSGPSAKAAQPQQPRATTVPAAASTSASTQAQRKKKRKGGLFSKLFGSCLSDSSHDDDGHGTGSKLPAMSERKMGGASAATAATGTSKPAGATSSNLGTASDDSLQKGVAMVDLNKGQRTSSGKGTGTGTNSVSNLAAAAGDNLNQSTTPSMYVTNTAGGAITSGLVGAGAGLGAIALLNSSTNSGSGVPPSPSGKSEIAPEVLAASQGGGIALPRDETADVLSGAVQAPGSEGLTPSPKKEKRRRSAGEASSMAMTTSNSDVGLAGDDSHVSSLHHQHQQHQRDNSEALEDETGSEGDADEEEEEYMDEDERIIAQGGIGIPIDENGNPRPLLAELTPSDHGRKCLVLDLDETLLHSSFKLVHSPDFVVPVEIENQVHNVYVVKRPGVDAFMKRMGEIYEVVIFTASLSKYADPVLDKLDIHNVVKHRLFRESCYNHKGNYVKDLSQLGRPIGETIILDNSPASYIFHPNNAVPVSSWFNDPHDTELTDLQNFLTDLADVPDVRGILDGGLYPN